MKRFAVISSLLALGLASGVALAACGGGSAPETPIVVSDTTAQLSTAEFISQADDICETANTPHADIAAAGEGNTRAADVADIRQGVINDIRALGTPVDDGTSSSATSTSSSSTDPTATASTNDTSTFPESTTSTGTSTSGSSSSSTGTGSSGTGTGATTTTGNDLEDFLTALAAQVKAGQKIDLASQRGESTAAAEAELSDAKSAAADAASSYGFLKCGSEGTSSGTTTSSTSSSSSSPSTVTPSAPSTSAPSTGGGTSGTSTSGGSGGVGSGGGVGPG
jgi:hypothetical protein